MSFNTNQVYNNLIVPKVQRRSNYGYNYTTNFSKYSYIPTSAFVVIQLNNGMWIRKNIDKNNNYIVIVIFKLYY